MLKSFLVVVIVIAIQISCTPANNVDSSSIKEMVESDPDFKILCANVSDVDLQRNDRLYQEYDTCVNEKVESNQLSEDMENLRSAFSSNSQVTNEQTSMVVATIKKYCPNANSITKCEEILSPIFTDCFTDEQRKILALIQRLKLSSLDFFCQDDAKQAETFIKEKFLDCMHANDDELDNCPRMMVSFQKGGDDKVTYATENEFCKSIENYSNCFIPKMEQCELSQTIGTLLKSFNTYILTNVCTSSTNPTSK